MTEEPIAEKKPPFYEEVKKPDGGTANLISGQPAAKELAGLEDTQGRDVALGREAELKREHETGLTDSERANIELMDGLKEKYPDAFIDTLDDKNRRLLVLKQADKRRQKDPVYTQLGHFFVTGDSPEDFNLTEVLDSFLPQNRLSGTVELKHKSTNSLVGIIIERVDLSDKNARAYLNTAHKNTQETQEKIAQTKKAQEKPPTPQEIHAEL